MNNLFSVLEKKREVGICPRFTERKNEVAQHFFYITQSVVLTLPHIHMKKKILLFPNIHDITGKRSWDF